MMSKWLFIFYHFFIINVDSITRTPTNRYGLFVKVHQDKYLSHTPLAVHQVTTFKECARFCLRNTQCKSFNLHNTECAVLSKDRNDSHVFVDAVGHKYYESGE